MLTILRNGITSTHIGFINRGHVVILCFAVQPSQQINRDVAAITIAVNDNKPCIIVVCCSPIVPDQNLSFPTVIQTAGYSPAALEATVELIFGEDAQPQPSCGSGSLEARKPRSWKVEEWNQAKDAAGVVSNQPRSPFQAISSFGNPRIGFSQDIRTRQMLTPHSSTA